jgi:uncharacterized glyoxalase superfamily protein PhnB
MTAPTPQAWHTITPRIVTRDVAGLVGFLNRVFDATGVVPDGRPAEVWIGDSVVMVSDAEQRAPMGAFLYVYVADVDATYAQAMEAGATATETPRDLPYGDRRAMFSDGWGNVWQVAARGA